jgi:hypothetical protein
MKCRNCNADVNDVFLNLYASPASNSFIKAENLNDPEPYYPLVVHYCKSCLLVQVDEPKAASDIFHSDYVYFSSTSAAFIEHARNYVDMVSDALSLDTNSFVVEAASNDGYLLQWFNKKDIPCLGIEPSGSTAKVAREKGIDTREVFFGQDTAKNIVKEKGQADLFLGNNVVAHVPDLDDFIRGIELLLKDTGTVTLEFPHLLTLIEDVQFDTVYHEHFSYFSLLTIQNAFERRGLYIYRVDEVNVHGGSLRIFGAKTNSGIEVQASVATILQKERDFGLDKPAIYESLQPKVNALVLDFMDFIITQKKAGKKIAAYGAAAKGNTFLNYCAIKPYMIDFVADLTPAKQGRYLPGSHIPVYGEDKITEEKPDYIVILAWNWKDAIKERLAFTSAWGCKLVIAVPKLEIL